MPGRPLSRKEDTNEPCIGRASNFNLELDMIRIGWEPSGKSPPSACTPGPYVLRMVMTKLQSPGKSADYQLNSLRIMKSTYRVLQGITYFGLFVLLDWGFC